MTADKETTWSRPCGTTAASRSTIFRLDVGWQETAEARRTARAVAEGRDAVFPGWVLGSRPYCQAPGGLLVLTETALHHVADRAASSIRQEVPVGRLVVTELRPGTLDDHRQMPQDWDALDCLDGEDRILIACHKLEMPYVEPLFRRD